MFVHLFVVTGEESADFEMDRLDNLIENPHCMSIFHSVQSFDQLDRRRVEGGGRGWGWEGTLS